MFSIEMALSCFFNKFIISLNYFKNLKIAYLRFLKLYMLKECTWFNEFLLKKWNKVRKWIHKKISYHHVLWCSTPLWHPCKQGTPSRLLTDHLTIRFLIFYVNHPHFRISSYHPSFHLLYLALLYILNIWSSFRLNK